MILQKFKQKWQIKSNFQLAVIFIVFAINGSLSSKIVFFLMDFIGFTKQNFSVIFYYLIATFNITIIYPFLIIAIGSVFGQFEFFFKFAKNMLQKIGLGFIFEEKNPE